MGIGGEEILRLAMKVSKVAAASAGDENLFPQAVGVFEHSDAAPAFSRFDGAHQASCATADNDCIEGASHGRSHVEQAQARQMIFLNQFLMNILLLQLIDLRGRHFPPVGSKIAIGLRADGHNLFVTR